MRVAEQDTCSHQVHWENIKTKKRKQQVNAMQTGTEAQATKREPQHILPYRQELNAAN
jgi:hypothetical protein